MVKKQCTGVGCYEEFWGARGNLRHMDDGAVCWREG